jgi:hypothetical protein
VEEDLLGRIVEEARLVQHIQRLLSLFRGEGIAVGAGDTEMGDPLPAERGEQEVSAGVAIRPRDDNACVRSNALGWYREGNGKL